MSEEQFKTMAVARAAGARKPAGWWSSSELPAFLEAKHCRRVANFALMVTVLIVVVVLVDYFAIGTTQSVLGTGEPRRLRSPYPLLFSWWRAATDSATP